MTTPDAGTHWTGRTAGSDRGRGKAVRCATSLAGAASRNVGRGNAEFGNGGPEAAAQSGSLSLSAGRLRASAWAGLPLVNASSRGLSLLFPFPVLLRPFVLFPCLRVYSFDIHSSPFPPLSCAIRAFAGERPVDSEHDASDGRGRSGRYRHLIMCNMLSLPSHRDLVHFSFPLHFGLLCVTYFVPAARCPHSPFVHAFSLFPSSTSPAPATHDLLLLLSYSRTSTLTTVSSH